MVMIDKLLNSLSSNEGSDLHLIVDLPPSIRINGSIRKLETPPLTIEDIESLVRSITTDKHLAELTSISSGGSINFALDMLGMRFRVNICIARGQKRIVIRRLPSKLLTCDQIGLPRQLVGLLKKDRGLILVTGATGSGKTTTLASMVTHIAQRSPGHIIAIEDPTEYILPHGIGITTQREVGIDLPDFQVGIIEALREDPDVILIGEMRNKETMQAAITAAETGHLVLATLHTSSAASTVSRIVDSFPESDHSSIRAQLASNIIGIISQKLIPKASGEGVIAAIEFLSADTGIQQSIRKGEYHKIPSQIQTGGAKFGMRLMDDSIFQLWLDDKISREDALDAAKDSDEIAKKIAQAIRDMNNS